MTDPRPPLDAYRHPLSGMQVGPVGLFELPPDFDPASDPRGVLWQWELPRCDSTYVLACDPTVGIPGWTIWTRTRDDREVDNAAIEVLRVGKRKLVRDGKTSRVVTEPDVQVAEWAAPIDPIACAAVINAIGKLYRGDSEDDGCLVNLEVYPGPGIATFPELFTRWGYTNIFSQPYLDTPTPRRTPSYGFTASARSKQLLWTKGVRHMHQGMVRLQSPWLLEECVDANADRFVSRALGPRHDDRYCALLMAIWAAHNWSFDMDEVEESPLQPVGSSPHEHQRMLISAASARAADEEAWARMLDAD